MNSADAVIKSLIFDVVVRVVIQTSMAALPILGWPVIAPLFGWVVIKIATLIYDELSKHVQFLLIDIQTEQQKQAYDKATTELKTAIDSGTNVDEAKEKFKNSLRDLIRFGVVR